MPGHFGFRYWHSGSPAVISAAMEKPPQHDLDDIRLTGFWGMLPLRFHPYVTVARLDRPIGWWLLLLPGWFAIILGGYTVAAPPNVLAA